MGEINAVVVDTHPLIFFASRSRRLSRRASSYFDACEEQRALLYIPVAVIWETCLLVKVGKVALHRSPQRFFEELFTNPAYQPVDLTAEQVFMADSMQPNRDPFDALICAVARQLELPLMSRDEEIGAFGGVETFW